MAMDRSGGGGSSLSRSQKASASRYSGLAKHYRKKRKKKKQTYWKKATAEKARKAGLKKSSLGLPPPSAPTIPGLNKGQSADAARYTGLALSYGMLPNTMSAQMASILGIPEEDRLSIYSEEGPIIEEPGAPALYDSGWGFGDGGGGGGGGGGGYEMFKWGEEGYELAGGAAPDWWRPYVPEKVTPETSYGAMLNAMIPFLSPEDQVRVAHSLYTMFDTELSRYKPGYIPEVSTVTEDQARYMMEQGRPVSGVWGGSEQKQLATGETIATRTSETEPLSDQMRRYYMSSKRATDAIQTLSNMREAMVQGNRWKLGPGYKWLQNIMGSVAGRGGSGETAQTRQQHLSMLSAVDPFLSQAGSGELQAFGPLGQMLTKPYFTAGSMQPQREGRFGTPNRRFF